MLAAGLRNFSIFLGRAISSMRRFRTSLLLRAVGIVVLVLLLPGWIDWLGLMGAAWALTLSWLVTVLLSLAAVLREVRRCRQHGGLLGEERIRREWLQSRISGFPAARLPKSGRRQNDFGILASDRCHALARVITAGRPMWLV